MKPSRTLSAAALAFVGLASSSASAATWSLAPQDCQDAVQTARELSTMVHQAQEEATIVCATTGWLTLGITCMQMNEWNQLADKVEAFDRKVSQAGGDAYAYGHSDPVEAADYIYGYVAYAADTRHTVDRSIFDDDGPTTLMFSDGWAAHYRGPMLNLSSDLQREAFACETAIGTSPQSDPTAFTHTATPPLSGTELSCRLQALARGADPVASCAVPADEHYTQADGSDYRGLVSVTVSGRTCQNWTAQAPHAHGYAADDATGIGDHNFCRTAGWREPWCYTDDPAVRWERCDVSQGYTASAEAPAGPTTTVSGLTCQNWTAQAPHAHTRTAENYPGQGIGDHNTCIDPDNTGAPWCYTTDPAVRWDYCQ